MDSNNQNWNNNVPQNNYGQAGQQQYDGQQNWNGQQQQQYNQQQYSQQQYGQQGQHYVNIDYNGQAMNDGTKTAAAVGALGLISVLPNILLIASIISLFCCAPLSIIILILSIIYSCILGKNSKVGKARVLSIVSIIIMIIGLIVFFNTYTANKINHIKYEYNDNEKDDYNSSKKDKDIDYVSGSTKDNIYQVIIDNSLLKLNDKSGNNVSDLSFNLEFYFNDYPKTTNADSYSYLDYSYNDSENIGISYTLYNKSEDECDIEQCELKGVHIYRIFDEEDEQDILDSGITFDFGYGITSDTRLSEIVSTLMKLDSNYIQNDNGKATDYIFSILETTYTVYINMSIEDDRLLDLSLELLD